MSYNTEKECTFWRMTGEKSIPEIIAVQSNTVVSGTYQLYFRKDKKCIPEKLIFTLDNDTALAARILAKILLRLKISPETALNTAKKFYRMTKEFPQGN